MRLRLNWQLSILALQLGSVPVFERERGNYPGAGLFRDGRINHSRRFSFSAVF